MFRTNIWTILLLILVFAILIAVVSYLRNMFFIFSKKDAPYVGSFSRQLNLMKEKLKLDPNKAMVDLGCWDGKALRFFSKNYKFKQLDGFEIKRIAYLRWKILNFFHNEKKISLFYQSFFDADLKKYDYIYVYLLPDQLARIEDRVFSNIKKEAIIISNSFQFSKHKPYKTIKNEKGKEWIYLYRK